MHSKQIKLFCQLGIKHNIYKEEDLQNLLKLCSETTTLLQFAQATLSNKFTKDLESVKKIISFVNAKIPITENITAKTDSLTRPKTQKISAEDQTHIDTTNYPFNMDSFITLSQKEQPKKILYTFLQQARNLGASDVHISAGSYPHIRLLGKNFLLTNQGILSDELAEAINLAAVDEEKKNQFLEDHDLDYSLDFGNGERFRVNLMFHNRGIQGTYRIISNKIPSLRELGFHEPKVLQKLTTYNQGLILVTGPSGSGKTTTLSALIELINIDRNDHIITIEDPVEILVPSKECNVSQRQLYDNTKSYANALRAALREDPDIIVIGELRDLETIEMAMSAAETGHLVFATLHTNNAISTLNRLLDVFPSSQQEQIRSMVAESLKGIICQRLLPHKNNTQQILSYEILLGTLSVGKMIKDHNVFQLNSVIETNKKLGMIGFEECIIGHVRDGNLDPKIALSYVSSPSKIEQLKRLC